jgi:hypothetical protein
MILNRWIVRSAKRLSAYIGIWNICFCLKLKGQGCLYDKRSIPVSIVTPIFRKGSLLVHLTFWQQPFIKIIVGTTTSEIYTTYIGTAGLLLNTKWNVRNGKVDVNSFVVK